MIALIVGPDAASARAAVAKLVAEHDPQRLNTTRLDGKTISIDEATRAIGTPSFFGGGRVVIVDDLMARASRAGAGAGERSDDEAAGAKQGLDFAGLFTAAACSNLLILVDPSLASVPAAIKKVAPADASIVVSEPPRGSDLVQWIQQKALDAGSSIDGRTARELAERSFPQTWANRPTNPAFDRPPDLDRLGNDLEKLALAAYPGAIDLQLVQAMVASAAEDRLFPFVEAAATSRLDEALPIFEKLQAGGDDSGRLSAQLFQQIELAAVVAEAGAPADAATVGKAIGLSNPNRMVGVARTAKRGRVNPRSMVRIALDIERRSKRGGLRQPIDVVYHLLTAAAPSPGAHEQGDT